MPEFLGYDNKVVHEIGTYMYFNATSQIIDNIFHFSFVSEFKSLLTNIYQCNSEDLV